MGRVSTKQRKKIPFEPKITGTGPVSRLFRFIFKTNDDLVSVCFGVSNEFRNNRNKQFCFKMNQNKPKMYIEQPKQIDLFRNEPKQTKKVLKISKVRRIFAE